MLFVQDSALGQLSLSQRSNDRTLVDGMITSTSKAMLYALLRSADAVAPVNDPALGVVVMYDMLV